MPLQDAFLLKGCAIAEGLVNPSQKKVDNEFLKAKCSAPLSKAVSIDMFVLTFIQCQSAFLTSHSNQGTKAGLSCPPVTHITS